MTKIRHDVMLRLVKVLDVVMITLPFAACWIWYYAAKTPMDGTWQGHAVILGLYAVLFILLGKTYDAFWMSMQRVDVRSDLGGDGDGRDLLHCDLSDGH